MTTNPSRLLRRSAAVTAPLLLLCAVLLLGACEEKMKPPRVAFGEGEDIPDQESWNSTVTFSDSGVVKAVLVSGHIRMYGRRYETLLDSGLVVDFYDAGGEHTSRLSADRGRVADRTKDLEAFGNVVFVSDSGTVVETEYMKWTNQTRMVSGDRFVTITSPKERLQGYGFEADQGLKNYTVFGQVRGEAELQE
jgi:LPS export ABC transporter protein LptC